MACFRLRDLRLGSATAALSLSVAALSPITSYAQDGFAEGEVGEAASPAGAMTTETGTTVLTPREDGGYDYVFTDPRGVVSAYSYNEQGQILLEDAPERGLITRRYDDNGNMVGLSGEGGLD